MEKNKRLFNQSGCLSREAILAWLENRLSPSERILMEDHLKGCDLCRDAIEGFERSDASSTRKMFAGINHGMQQRILKSENKTISRRMKLTMAAAIFLLLLGIFTTVKFLAPQAQVQVAHHMNQERLETKTPEPLPEPPVSARETKKTMPAAKSPVKQLAEEKKITDEIMDKPAEAAPVLQEEPAVAEIPAATETAKAEESSSVAYSAPAPSMAKKRNEPIRAKEARYSEKALSVESDKNSETTFYVVEQPARFRGGDISKFKAYVEEKVYDTIRDKPLEKGNITVNFTVDRNGKVKDVFVVKGIEARTDSTVKSIVSGSPDWKPALHQGKTVNVNMVLPLTIH